MHIYSDLSSSKTEKWTVFQEFHYRWWKWVFYDDVQQWIEMDESLLLISKAVDWQGWISAAYPKAGVSWKKNYALSLVESQQYYSFEVFKQQSDTQCRLIFSTIAKWAWKSPKKKSWNRGMLGFSMITKGHFQQESY